MIEGLTLAGLVAVFVAVIMGQRWERRERREDLAAIERRITAVEGKLREEITAAKGRLREEITAAEGRLREEITAAEDRTRGETTIVRGDVRDLRQSVDALVRDGFGTRIAALEAARNRSGDDPTKH